MTHHGGVAVRILVVEDEPSISQVCLRVLTGEGFEVEIAVNGKVAHDMIGKKLYDLLLLDIRTPAMSGKELYQWLKGKNQELARRVIFTTGDLLSGDTKTFLERCNLPFLPKPFTPTELKAIISETLKEQK